jgi:two-component system, NarL family, sensor kinase
LSILQIKLFAGISYYDSIRNVAIKASTIPTQIIAYDNWLPIGIALQHDSISNDIKAFELISKASNNELAKGIYELNYAFWLTQKTGNYTSGLEYCMHAKNIFEKIDAKPQLAATLNRIALFKLLNEIAQNKLARDSSLYKEYLFKVQQLANELHDKEILINTYLIIGSYQIVSNKDYKSALQSFYSAENLMDKNTTPLNRTTILGSIAITFADSANEQKMLEYIQKFEQEKYASLFYYSAGNLYRSAAKYYLNFTTDYAKALQYALLSYEKTKALNAPEFMSQSEKRLYEVYRKMGNKEMALEYLEKYRKHEEEISRNRFEMAYTDYDVQSKEKTILEQQFALQKKNILLYCFLAFVAILSIVGYFILKVRKKNQLLKIQEIENQKQIQLDIAVRETEEEERKRISSNLHDSVVQKLVVAKMNTQALTNSGSVMDEKQTGILKNMMALLEESTAEIRQLSHTIMPASLEEDGLGKVVKDFTAQITSDDLQIKVYEEGDFKNINKNKAIIVYRIIQECIQNSLKHAQAKHISISLLIENNKLELTIEDDGIGFEVSKIKHDGIGLNNIKNRVKQLDGLLDIESQPNNGTLISIQIPV